MPEEMPISLRKILTCIQKNYHNPVFDINVLHQSIKQSASYSRVIFKREYGCSLHDILEMLRASDALEWLADNAEIESFYNKVGFVTPKTLRETFHRRFGCSPSQCRALLAKSADKNHEIEHLRRMLCADNDRIYHIIQKSIEERMTCK